jgi:hypothetical protein
MRKPKRKRLKSKMIGEIPPGIDLLVIAERVMYAGSSEHKSGPSFAGEPRPRADASICDPSLNDRQDDIQNWLRHAIRLGCVAPPWEGVFPRYAWCKVSGTVYEARLINRALGQYKGWEIPQDEWPDRIDEFDWSALV